MTPLSPPDDARVPLPHLTRRWAEGATATRVFIPATTPLGGVVTAEVIYIFVAGRDEAPAHRRRSRRRDSTTRLLSMVGSGRPPLASAGFRADA